MACLLISLPGIAQNKMISGKVTSGENKTPLSGVNLVIKGKLSVLKPMYRELFR